MIVAATFRPLPPKLPSTAVVGGIGCRSMRSCHPPLWSALGGPTAGQIPAEEPVHAQQVATNEAGFHLTTMGAVEGNIPVRAGQRTAPAAICNEFGYE